MNEKTINNLIIDTISLCLMNRQIDLMEDCNLNPADIANFKVKREIMNNALLDTLLKITNR